MRRIIAAALWAGGIASSIGVASPSRAQQVQGCWYFSQNADARALDLPWGVQLTDESLVGWPGLADEPDVRVAVTLEGRSATANRPFGYWQPLGPDSLVIGYPGLSGLALRVGMEGRWLRGTPVPGRAGGPDPGSDRSIRMMRGQCPEGV